MARTQKEIIKQTEEFLDERWDITEMIGSAFSIAADTAYYKGAIAAIESLGYGWKRDKNGKHTLFKCEE